MDRIHRITNWMDHNRWTLLSLLLAAGAVAVLAGCRSRTQGLNGAEAVDRAGFEVQVLAGEKQLITQRARLEAAVAEFNGDVERFNAQVDLGRGDLDAQDAVRAELLTLLGNGLTDALAGRLNPAAFVMPGLALLGAALGIGKTLDNRRKDKVIARMKVGHDGSA